MSIKRVERMVEDRGPAYRHLPSITFGRRENRAKMGDYIMSGMCALLFTGLDHQPVVDLDSVPHCLLTQRAW